MASDQMVTAGIPMPYEFETDEVRKIYNLCDDIYLLTAGNALFSSEVVERAGKNIREAGIPMSVESAGEQVRIAYQTRRREILIQEQLETRGLDLNQFYNLHQRMQPAIVHEIDSAFSKYRFPVDLIICGKDEGGCHIYTVLNPGVLVCHDEIGFVAVGVGAPHAMYSLISNDYRKSMAVEEMETLVEEAKKRSQVAPGVGDKTTRKVVGETKETKPKSKRK